MLPVEYDDDFFRSLADQCPQVGIDPKDFILLVAGECDFVWTAKNKYGFQGMTQMGAAALRAAGWDSSTMGEFCAAKPIVQLPYSLRYFRSHTSKLPENKYSGAAELWLANLAPAHLGRADGVVYSKANHPRQYAANAGLDVDRDGVITVADLQAKMDQLANGTVAGRKRTGVMYAEAVQRLSDIVPTIRTNQPVVRPAVGVRVMDRPVDQLTAEAEKLGFYSDSGSDKSPK